MPYLWKEFLEQTRGKGLWFGLGMVALTSLLLVIQARSYPADLGFEAMLLSLFDMNMYLLPLLAMFLASFSVFQEKEQKTLLMLITKRESGFTFLTRKSLALQAVLLGAFAVLYILLAFPMKVMLNFNASGFGFFLLATMIFLAIFVQAGVFLGVASRNKMQLIGANILMWFVVVFLLDLVYLYFLPAVNVGNVKAFSWLYFLNPIHAVRLMLENKLGLFSLVGMSRMMSKLVFMNPLIFAVINLFLWPSIFFGLSLAVRNAGADHD